MKTKIPFGLRLRVLQNWYARDICWLLHCHRLNDGNNNDHDYEDDYDHQDDYEDDDDDDCLHLTVLARLNPEPAIKDIKDQEFLYFWNL